MEAPENNKEQEQDKVKKLNKVFVSYYCVKIMTCKLDENLDYTIIKKVSDEKGKNCES